MKKIPKQSNFYPIIDKNFLDDTDAVYVFVTGERCEGKRLAEQIFSSYREVMNYEKTQEK